MQPQVTDKMRASVLGAMITSRARDIAGLETIYHALPQLERRVVDNISASLAGDDVELRALITRALLIKNVMTADEIDDHARSMSKFAEAFESQLGTEES